MVVKYYTSRLLLVEKKAKAEIEVSSAVRPHYLDGMSI